MYTSMSSHTTPCATKHDLGDPAVRGRIMELIDQRTQYRRKSHRSLMGLLPRSAKQQRACNQLRSVEHDLWVNYFGVSTQDFLTGIAPLSFLERSRWIRQHFPVFATMYNDRVLYRSIS